MDYEQALNICKKLEPYDLEYIEDPAPGIEAMSRLEAKLILLLLQIYMF